MTLFFRQLRFPREYRLPPAMALHDEADLEEAIERAISLAQAGGGDATPGAQLEDALPDLAIQLWRLGNRLIDPESRQPTEQTRIAYSRLEAVWDSMRSLGIEVRDYTFQEVAEHGVTGFRILAEEPRADLERRTVIETVKPAVIYKGKELRMAEVIVGFPPAEEETEPPGD